MLKLLFAAALGLASCTGPRTIHLTDEGQRSSTCQEDEACWNCLTMGDRSCGSADGIQVFRDDDGHITVLNRGELVGWTD